MSDQTRYHAAAILDTWVHHEWAEGVQLASVPDFTEIEVQTRNTVYQIVVIDGATREVLIRGGRFFPEQTEGRIAGSSLGGSFLKVGGIYTGFNMEILAAGVTIVTTAVQSIRISP
jgi:stage V sporulation protein SpoVS